MTREEAKKEIAAVIRRALDDATWEELVFILFFLRN